MSDEVGDDIRTTSEEIKADAELLANLERRKQIPNTSDEDLQRLSAQAEELASRMAHKTRIEKKLVDQATKG